jgi:AcrR family transcriptional regulator
LKTITSRNKWINAVYIFFAENGPENFPIKRLAEIADLPRTNFYYHFKENDELIDEIIKLQFGVAEEYLMVIKDELKESD